MIGNGFQVQCMESSSDFCTYFSVEIKTEETIFTVYQKRVHNSFIL